MVFFQSAQMLNSSSLFKFISQKEAENQKFCIAFRYAESKGGVIGKGLCSDRVGGTRKIENKNSIFVFIFHPFTLSLHL